MSLRKESTSSFMTLFGGSPNSWGKIEWRDHLHFLREQTEAHSNQGHIGGHTRTKFRNGTLGLIRISSYCNFSIKPAKHVFQK